ncbi:MAG: tetratricopeptide repeat protein [Planctomycetes bacterium]|nr:tetratricopeptide repeat protein [Planctomycetota bacterium]
MKCKLFIVGFVFCFSVCMFAKKADSSDTAIDKFKPALVVDLRRDDTTFIRGEPITFAVRMMRSPLDHGEPLYIGSKGKPWHGRCKINVFQRYIGVDQIKAKMGQSKQGVITNKQHPPDTKDPNSTADAGKVKRYLYIVDPNAIQVQSNDKSKKHTPEIRKLQMVPPSPDDGKEQIKLERKKIGATKYYTILSDNLESGQWTIIANIVTHTKRGKKSSQVIEYESKEVHFDVREMDPTDSRDRVHVARSVAIFCNFNGDYKGAIEALTPVIPDFGLNRYLHIELGVALQRQGNINAAIDQYRKYISWARGSGIPRSQISRGPQEIADQFEELIKFLLTKKK